MVYFESAGDLFNQVRSKYLKEKEKYLFLITTDDCALGYDVTKWHQNAACVVLRRPCEDGL